MGLENKKMNQRKMVLDGLRNVSETDIDEKMLFTCPKCGANEYSLRAKKQHRCKATTADKRNIRKNISKAVLEAESKQDEKVSFVSCVTCGKSIPLPARDHHKCNPKDVEEFNSLKNIEEDIDPIITDPNIEIAKPVEGEYSESEVIADLEKDIPEYESKEES